jgi:hypothetical protein
MARFNYYTALHSTLAVVAAIGAGSQLNPDQGKARRPA